MQKKSIKKWEKLSSEIVYRGKKFSVVLDNVLLPNGDKSQYEYLKKSDFVVIIPKEKNFLYMVEQFRYPVDKRLLEFPQGVCFLDETPIATAKRELEEEVGIQAENIKLLGIIDPAKSISGHLCYVFLATGFKKGKLNLDKSEHDLISMKVSIDSLEKMIKDNKVTEETTLAAYTLFCMKEKKD